MHSNMYKDGVLTFSDWNKGQVKHPIYGFGTLRNVEVFESKGIAKLKNRATPRTSITPTQLPIAEVYDTYGNTYTLTGETGQGSFYKNGSVVQPNLPNCWDICIYKDYVLVRHSTVMSAYGPLSGSATWFSNVATGFSDVHKGKLLVGQDDFIYSGNGNYVAKMSLTPPVSDPALNPPTVSANLTALDLPDGQFVTTLEEYGTNIVIGTSGGSNYYDRGNSPTARLYKWNRQLGTLGNPGLADLPIIFSENGINAIKQHANKLYVSAGTQGNIYVTDATNYIKITTLPYTKTGTFYYSQVQTNALSISPQGTLLVGLSGDLNDFSKPGIYEVDINASGYPVSYRTPTSYTDGTIKIGFINSKSYQELNVGWSNNATYGVDTSDFVMYPSYGGVIETELAKVGNARNKVTFQHIEWSLAEPLVAGQNIRISYRKNSNEDYTLIDTWGFNPLGSVISFSDVAGITDAEYVQLKIELDQATNTVYGSNINLISVTLS